VRQRNNEQQSTKKKKKDDALKSGQRLVYRAEITKYSAFISKHNIIKKYLNNLHRHFETP
jgi:hypothetical protein